MTTYEKLQRKLRRAPGKWLVTGVAGFIGSHIAEKLLQLNQKVVGLDNFSTGKRENLEDLQGSLNAKQRSAFRFIEGDITCDADCKRPVGEWIMSCIRRLWALCHDPLPIHYQLI